IASGFSDEEIRVWDAATGAERHAACVARSFGPVYTVMLSPDGRRIVSGSFDTTVREWDTATGT
ncbi:hypothetical protein B0I37DRAFT_291894, partial [Chaetomium sp. MPI-CAGE-AT-0009]